jgi:uncharacterized membrane protein YuzA (DUF378 family)
MKLKRLDILALVIIFISALNGVLVGLFQLNLLNTFFGPVLEKLIAAIIGVTLIYIWWRGSKLKAFMRHSDKYAK